MTEPEPEAACSAIRLYAQALAMVIGGATLGFVWGLAEILATS